MKTPKTQTRDGSLPLTVPQFRIELEQRSLSVKEEIINLPEETIQVTPARIDLPPADMDLLAEAMSIKAQKDKIQRALKELAAMGIEVKINDPDAPGMSVCRIGTLNLSYQVHKKEADSSRSSKLIEQIEEGLKELIKQRVDLSLFHCSNEPETAFIVCATQRVHVLISLPGII